MFQQCNPNEMPGIGTSYLNLNRDIWLGRAGVQYLPGGAGIDGSLSRDPANTSSVWETSGAALPPGTAPSYVNTLQAGLLMGKITTGGKYRPSIIGLTTAAIPAGARTSFTVSAACATELTRLLGSAASMTITLTGYDTVNTAVAQTAAITVTQVSGTTVTASFTLVNSGAFAAGAFVGPADGSQNPTTFIDELDGIRVTDVAGGNLTVQFPRVPIAGGMVNTAVLVNYPGTTNTGYASLQSYIKAMLNSAGLATSTTWASVVGGRFTFSEDFSN